MKLNEPYYCIHHVQTSTGEFFTIEESKASEHKGGLLIFDSNGTGWGEESVGTVWHKTKVEAIRQSLYRFRCDLEHRLMPLCAMLVQETGGL